MDATIPPDRPLEPRPTAEDEALYELWDEERLRRQVAVYETAIREEIAERRDAQAMAAGLRTELESLGQNQQNCKERAERLEAEADRLRARLDEIEGSRAWHAVSRYRRWRERIFTRRSRGRAT